MTLPPRGALRAAAVAMAVLSAFVAGAVTGAGARGTSTGTRPTGSGSGVLDEAADRIVSQSVRPVDRATLDKAAVQGMLGALDDRWSAYYGSRDYPNFQQSLDGSYSGVGLWLRRDTDDRLLVAGVLPASAAAAADLRVGDEVTSVGGRMVRGRSVADVVAALRGPVGSSVAVGVRRDTATRGVVLRREEVVANDVSVDAITPTVSRIRVAAFTRGVGRQVRAAMAALGAQRAGGVVLDLRGDPGGLLDEAVETASVFLDGGQVVSYARRGQPPRVLDAAAGGDTNTPLVVLVDGGTASAAEVVAGALQDRARAVVVGSRTFGKGSVQEPARLSDGSALELTVARYLTPNGRSLDGTGLEPDIEVPAAGVGGAFGGSVVGAPGGSAVATDVAVRRGVDVLAGLLADAAGHQTGRG